MIVMNQGVARFAQFNGPREKLAAALGIVEADFDGTLPIIYGSTGRWTLVVPVHARHFSSPGSGILEDAVTGTASGVLGAYDKTFIRDAVGTNLPLVVEQGYEVQREGTVQVWADKRAEGYAVRIAGSACFVRDIEINHQRV